MVVFKAHWELQHNLYVYFLLSVSYCVQCCLKHELPLCFAVFWRYPLWRLIKDSSNSTIFFAIYEKPSDWQSGYIVLMFARCSVYFSKFASTQKISSLCCLITWTETINMIYWWLQVARKLLGFKLRWIMILKMSLWIVLPFLIHFLICS